MIYLEADGALCLARIAKRVEDQPDRANFDTPEVFREVAQYFEEPDDGEGLATIKVDQ